MSNLTRKAIEESTEQLDMFVECEEYYRKNYRVVLPPELLFPALDTALAALRECAERRENKPLTIEAVKRHLSKRHPYEIKPLYVVFIPPMPIDSLRDGEMPLTYHNWWLLPQRITGLHGLPTITSRKGAGRKMQTSEDKQTCAGYDLDELILIAALLRSNQITPDELHRAATNFKAAHELIDKAINESISRTIIRLAHAYEPGGQAND